MNRIIFFGSPAFAATTLDYLLEHQANIVAIVTKPDRPKGRSGKPQPPAVKKTAQEHSADIPIYQPEKVSCPEFIEVLKNYDADLFVVVAFGEILSEEVLEIPKKACINVHGSILPKYRGAAPIQRCILNGEKESGVTIMHMVKKMDAGDMIKVVRVPIGENMNAAELEQELNDAGKKALLEVIESGNFEGEVQDESEVTFAPKISPEDCQIDWKEPAEKVHNKIRAFSPRPGAWCTLQFRGEAKRLKILSSRLAKEHGGKPGEILDYGKDQFLIACGEGAIQVIGLQLEGKNPVVAESFMRGIPKEEISFC